MVLLVPTGMMALGLTTELTSLVNTVNQAAQGGPSCQFQHRSPPHLIETSSSRSSRVPGPPTSAARWCFSSPQNIGNLPYAIFDWGAICRLSLEPGARGASEGRFAWQSRSIQTPGKRLYDRHPEQFSAGATGYMSPFGPPNASNTAPLPWGNRLFTTWDAGRPVELHPETLEFVAEVGHVDTLGRQLVADGRRAPVPVLHRAPRGRPRAPLPLDRQARAGHGSHVRDATVPGALGPRRRHPGPALAARGRGVLGVDPHREPEP